MNHTTQQEAESTGFAQSGEGKKWNYNLGVPWLRAVVTATANKILIRYKEKKKNHKEAGKAQEQLPRNYVEISLGNFQNSTE